MTNKSIRTASALAILASAVVPAITVGVDVANAAEPNAISDFTFIIANDQVTITAYKGISKNVIIPSEIEGYPVTAIGENAFYYKGLSSITIPDSVTSMGYRAFAYNQLTSVTIPEGVTSIPDEAFRVNIPLTSVTLPSNLKSIGKLAFQDTQISTISIPEGVLSIGEDAFYNTKLKKITLPESVMSIGQRALGQLSQLEEVIVENPDLNYEGGPFAYTNTNFTLKGVVDSTTQQHATRYGYSFIPTNSNEVTESSSEGNDGSTGEILETEGGIKSESKSPIIGGKVEGTDSGTLNEGKTQHLDKATVKLQSGILNLNIANVLDFGTVRLEAQPKTITTGFGDFFEVIDTRGTQEGWRIDVTATPFKIVEPAGGFKPGTTTHKLPSGSLFISPLMGIEQVGQGTGTMPKGMLSGKTILDDGAITVASAGVGEGMGQFKLAFGSDALSLIVDATTAKIDNVNYPGGVTPYEATITWDLVTGP